LNDQIIIEIDFLKGMDKCEYKKEGKQTLKQKKWKKKVEKLLEKI